MSDTWQVQTAKNRFSELVERARRGVPQLVTKHGEPVVYVIDYETYQTKVASRRKGKKRILLERPHKELGLSIERPMDKGRTIDL